MKRVWFFGAVVILLTLGVAACQPVVEGPQIEVSDVWGRPSPMKEGNGAIYMTITNLGSEDDRLLSAASDVAEVVELHDMTMENDVMKMFHVDFMDVPAGGSLELKPGGKHVMLIGLHEQLQPGQVVALTLQFEKAGSILVEAEIRQP
ncbi:MAG: hypothetical protein Kow002_18410 [Anaerolineales bacterium]